MPPKKQRKKKLTRYPTPWDIALANIGKAQLRDEYNENMDKVEKEYKARWEKDYKNVFQKGRQQEVADSLDGSYYTFDARINPTAKYPKGSAFSEAPEPTTELDLGQAKMRFGKMHGKLIDNPWVLKPINAATRLAVDDDIELDYGPDTNDRKYHVKIKRVMKSPAKALPTTPKR